jgi:hypothetical protein
MRATCRFAVLAQHEPALRIESEAFDPGSSGGMLFGRGMGPR